MSDLYSIVIAGGGLAGANAAFRLRELGFEGRITIVSAEAVDPYERPPMSKEYLRGEKSLADTLVKPQVDYHSNAIELVKDRTALELVTAEERLVLDDDSEIHYDALLLATGAAPRTLDVPGADLAGVHYLRDVADADRIRAEARDAGPVVVVGGGWIGTEVAASLRQLGCDVTIVSRSPLPLAHVLGDLVAGVYRRLHEEHGTRIAVGSVARIVGDDRVREVRLDDGARLAARLVVVGIGAAPRVELAARAGLKLRDGGIEVDEFLETSVPGIFAAGDIATAWHARYGSYLRLEHWDNAIEQGKLAAANILGRRQPYERTPYFYSDQFDLGMEVRGRTDGFDRVAIRGDLDARQFDAFWFSDGRVVAAMNANRWDDAAELKQLVESEARINPHALEREPEVEPVSR